MEYSCNMWAGGTVIGWLKLVQSDLFFKVHSIIFKKMKKILCWCTGCPVSVGPSLGSLSVGRITDKPCFWSEGADGQTHDTALYLLGLTVFYVPYGCIFGYLNTRCMY